MFERAWTRLLFVLLISAAAHLPATAATAQGGSAAGRLVIIGGGSLGSRPDVYRAVLDAREGSGPVCVIPTASATPESSLQSAVRAFDTHGGAGAAVGVPELTVAAPASGSDPAVVEALGRCSGYYFVGGVQSRIVTVFRPDGRSTPALETVQRRIREGAVVSGSSAGAAIMSHPMIGGGASGAMAGGVRRAGAESTEDPDAPGGALDLVSIQPGLGFFPEAIVDQHFLARGRFGRLLVSVLDMPEFDLGFGIDESTALVVDGGTASVVGASAVVVIDGAGAVREGDVTRGVRVHLMSPGDRFDLETRRFVGDPAKAALPATSAAVPVPDDLFARWAFFHLLDALARSSQTEVSLPVSGGQILLRKDADFGARGLEGQGVEGTTAGLSVTGLTVELRRGAP